ncbi:lytic transglycosylase domain-containing protein [Hydrogenophaga sp. OTU3427]|uniref:lytic transglycosylase domain-containing protein n=1 Tax=Hydrogenophaga sp. OTU3427 TaxID=3043856 RepID=UPI00313DFA69
MLAPAALACLLAGTGSLAQAQVWMRADEEGVLHFSNQRQSGQDQLVLRSAEPAEAALPSDWAQAPASADMERAAQRIQASAQFDAVKPAMEQAATHFGVDHALVTAVMAAESAFNAQAVSPKGAIGLMQVMPATAKRFGVTARPGQSVERQLRDPETNIRAGTRYLAHLIQLFEGQLELAVAAYNAGEGAVMRAGNRVPNYRETRQYVVKVLGLYNALRSPG